MFTGKKITVSFTDRTVIRVVVIVALSLLMLTFFSKIAHALILIFLAFFLALALNPSVSRIATKLKRKSRLLATGVAYIIVLILLSGFLALVIPPLVRQTTDFAQALPNNIERYTAEDSAPMRFIRVHKLENDVNKSVQSLRGKVQNIGGSVVTTANTVITMVASSIAVLVMTFMMLVEGPMWLEKFWNTQDPEKSGRRKRVMTKMYRVITGYVNGQVIIAMIAGFFSLIALLIVSTLLDVSINAVVYALIITLTSLIPMFGATIGAVVVVILCAFASWPLALIMAVFFLVYQQVENATIQPQVQAKQNELTPLIVFISALVGLGFGGLLGAFMAIPIAGCARVLIIEYYGDRLSLHPKKQAPTTDN